MKLFKTIILLAFATAVFAADKFFVDYSSYKTMNDSITRTDIYISVPVANLKFEENESIFSVKVFIYDGNKLVAEDRWKQKYTIEDQAAKFSGAEIPAISKTALSPGYYGLKVEVKDLKADEVIDVLEVPQSSKKFKIAGFSEKMSMSTIQLAQKMIVKNADKDSEFYRQGAVILPNPSKIFGTNRPQIFYYSEIYGVNSGDDIEYNWFITDSEGDEVMKGQKKNIKAEGSSLTVADRIIIARLETGTYDLNLKVVNKTAEKTIRGSNNFYVYRKIDFEKKNISLPEMENNSARNSLVIDIMKDKEVQLEFDQVMSVLSKAERKKYKGLTLTGKREFLKKYWIKKEKEKDNARENFKSRVRQANREFSDRKNEGWETDRGRIYLKMGAPSRRDTETFNTEYTDHEIWTYFENNYTFVFADIHGLGDFKLIHSDMPGEKHDPNWRNKIKKGRF